MTQMEESFTRLLSGLYLAVIFMFLLLAAQFRSLLESVNMILSLSLTRRVSSAGSTWPARRSRPSRSSRS